MKSVAAMVAITVSILTGLLLVGPIVGAALAAPAPAQTDVLGPDGTGGPLHLALDQVTPRIVTADGPADLTITGTLTNTGTVPVRDLVIRVQRGAPLTTEGQLRDALDGSAGTDAVTPQFVPLTDELAPGSALPVRLAVPLRGTPDTGLGLTSAGVHELLVNVNGVPGGGVVARLAAARMLLPVLSLPPAPDAPPAAPDAGTAGGAAPFAMLYPIADTPRRLPTVPGEPALLTDDDLAASFGPEGRLGGLLGALTDAAPVGSAARSATCLAIDPDLVETAAQMRSGYQVPGPDGAPVPGAGAEAAGRWLDGLAAAARGSCVIALPYADADLVSLSRGGLGELATTAIRDGRQILAAALQTPVVPGVTWPAGGVADEPALARIADADGRSLVLSAQGVTQGRTQRNTGVLPIAGGKKSQFAVLTDPLLTLAATGRSASTGPVPRSGGAATPGAAAGTSAPLSTQDAIGALVFRSRDGSAASDRGGGPLVLAPPHQWAADGTGARALLDSVTRLLDAGRLVPRPLDVVLAAGPPPGTTSRAAAYPLSAGGREIATAALDTVKATAQEITDLRSAAVENSGVGVAPEDAFAPLRRGLVRPASAAWRGRPDVAVATADAAAGRIAELRASVRVLEPPGPYSLGTSDAPILITVANGLPFTVRVRVEIAPSAGLRVAPIGTQEIPPLGRRQVRASAQVTRSGQFTVEAAVRTPDGDLLGPPSRLRVRSTAYGTITVWLTGIAGVLLVVLAIRRILRRVRAGTARGTGPERPGPPDPGPEPVPPPPYRPAPGPGPTPPPRGPTRPRQVGRTRDPFPDPLGATDRLPAARPRTRGRPPGPPPPPVPRP